MNDNKVVLIKERGGFISRRVVFLIAFSLVVMTAMSSGCGPKPSPLTAVTVLGGGPGDEIYGEFGVPYNDPNYDAKVKQKRKEKEEADAKKKKEESIPTIGPPGPGIHILGPIPKIKRRKPSKPSGGFQGSPRVKPRTGCR